MQVGEQEELYKEMECVCVCVYVCVRLISRALSQVGESEPEELYEEMERHTNPDRLVVCHETDPQWRSAVLRDVPLLLALRRQPGDIVRSDALFFFFYLMYECDRVLSLCGCVRVCVRVCWSDVPLLLALRWQPEDVVHLATSFFFFLP